MVFLLMFCVLSSGVLRNLSLPMPAWGPPDVSWVALSELLLPFPTPGRETADNLLNKTICLLAREILLEKTNVCFPWERVLIALCQRSRAVCLTHSDRLAELAQDRGSGHNDAEERRLPLLNLPGACVSRPCSTRRIADVL